MERLKKFEGKQNMKKKYLEYIKDYVSENNYYNNIQPCGTYLEFISNIADLKSEDFKSKLKLANFCKNRFCPMCAWRKTIKDAIKINTIVKYSRIKEYKFLFLTLTVPNVKKTELNKRIDKLQDEIKLFFKYKDVKKFVVGYIKKLELTYNSKLNTFHPHFHLLIMVDKDYFINSQRYMQRNALLNLWQKATDDKSITQLDIRKVNNAEKEIAKYAAKSNDYLDNQKWVFDAFYKALKSRRLITYCKKIKEFSKMYDNGELDHLIETDSILYNYLLYFSKNVTKRKFEYKLDEIRELNSLEKEKINGHKLKYDIDMAD